MNQDRVMGVTGVLPAAADVTSYGKSKGYLDLTGSFRYNYNLHREKDSLYFLHPDGARRTLRAEHALKVCCAAMPVEKEYFLLFIQVDHIA